jgi:hypothetical protein
MQKNHEGKTATAAAILDAAVRAMDVQFRDA